MLATYCQILKNDIAIWSHCSPITISQRNGLLTRGDIFRTSFLFRFTFDDEIFSSEVLQNFSSLPTTSFLPRAQFGSIFKVVKTPKQDLTISFPLWFSSSTQVHQMGAGNHLVQQSEGQTIVKNKHIHKRTKSALDTVSLFLSLSHSKLNFHTSYLTLSY